MLSIMHKREASRLQQSGLLLREIANRLGCSFEQVCLYLYGGIDDWEPRIGAVTPQSSNTETDNAQRDGAGRPAHSTDGAGAGRAGRSDQTAGPRGDERTAAQGTEPDVVAIDTTAPAGTAAQRQEAVAPVDPPRPAPPPPVAEPTAPPPAAAGALPATGDIRLTNGAGDYLDRSGVGMTRLIGKAWRGTKAQAREIKKRRPQYRELEEEDVE